MSYLAYTGFSWNGAAKIESENLGGNNIFENSDRENNVEVEESGNKHSGIYNHRISASIQVDPNHTK